MSGGSKFSSQVPKGDAWGVEQALEAAAREFEETGHSPMIPCIAILGVKEVKLVSGDDGPARQIVAVLFRVEALTNPKAIKNGQKLILRAIEERKGGEGVQMLPFEEADILKAAFGGLNVDQIEQDEREEIEDQNIDDPERLRRHLVAIHGMTTDEVKIMEWVDVTTKHTSDHDALDAGDGGGLPDHDRESWIWRRVDLQAAEAESDGADSDDEPTGEAGEFDDADVTHEEDGSDQDETADVASLNPDFADGSEHPEA